MSTNVPESIVSQLTDVQQWLMSQNFTHDVEYNRQLLFLICNVVDTNELHNANGQAAEFLTKLAAALQSARTEGIPAAAERVKDAIAEIDSQLIREFFHSFGMAYDYFRQLPDETILVVSGTGMWFQQQDPDAIARFHKMVDEEREFVQRNLQQMPENASADLNHALTA